MHAAAESGVKPGPPLLTKNRLMLNGGWSETILHIPVRPTGAASGRPQSSCAVASRIAGRKSPFNLFMESPKGLREGIASAARYQKYVMDPSLCGPYNHP